MKAACLAALVLWPGFAVAEATFLPPLLNSLGDPERTAEAMAAALETAGFVVKLPVTLGPDVLPPNEADPYYFTIKAFVTPGPVLAADGKPEMVITCSRIGLATRDAIAKGAMVSALQNWSTAPDFEPGAVAQLKCRVDLLPLEGTILPTVDEVLAVIGPRFAKTRKEVGTAERPATGIGWVLYPPLEHMDQVRQSLAIGQTLIAGSNPTMSGPGKPDWIMYDHFQTEFMHSFVLTAHIQQTGS